MRYHTSITLILLLIVAVSGLYQTIDIELKNTTTYVFIGSNVYILSILIDLVHNRYRSIQNNRKLCLCTKYFERCC